MTKNFANNFHAQELVETIGRALGGKRNGKGGFDLCECPAHGGKQCLSIDQGADGVLLNCHTGCDFEAITSALRGMGLWPKHGEGAGKTTAEQAAESIARRRALEAEQATRYADAAAKAKALYEAANIGADATAHPYNQERGGRWTGHTARRGHWPFHGGDADALLLPYTDPAGALRTLQAISGTGRPFSHGDKKDYYPGGAKRGNFYTFFDLGAHVRRFFIGEGFFTVQAAQEAYYQANGEPPAAAPDGWIVAGDAGNLEPVAGAIHAAHPAAKIIILADEDEAGRKAANRAALATGGKVARPSAGLPTGANIAKGYDFDNLYNEAGAGAVCAALDKAAKPEGGTVKDAGEAAYQVQAAALAAQTPEDEETRRKREAQDMLAKIPAFDVWEALTVEPPPRPYILNGYLPTNVVVLLAAQGGTGKSFLSLIIAATVASGRNIPPFEVESGPQNVLIVNAEDSAIDIRPRLYDLAKAYELTQGEMRAIAQNLTVAPVRGIMGGLLKPGPHGTEPIETASAELLEMLIERHRPALVILDTKSRLYGLRESIAEDGAAWVSHLEKHLRAHPDTAFLVLTHTGKKNPATMKTQDAERGSSANVDNTRGTLVFHRVIKDAKTGEQLKTPDGAKVFCLSHVKSNYREERPDVYFIRGLGGVPIMIDDPTRESEAADRLLLAGALGVLCDRLAKIPQATIALVPFLSGKAKDGCTEEIAQIRNDLKTDGKLDMKRFGDLVQYGIDAGKLEKVRDPDSTAHNKPWLLRLATPPAATTAREQGGLF